MLWCVMDIDVDVDISSLDHGKQLQLVLEVL
jgi:hypothetical protein